MDRTQQTTAREITLDALNEAAVEATAAGWNASLPAALERRGFRLVALPEAERKGLSDRVMAPAPKDGPNAYPYPSVIVASEEADSTRQSSWATRVYRCARFALVGDITSIRDRQTRSAVVVCRLLYAGAAWLACGLGALWVAVATTVGLQGVPADRAEAALLGWQVFGLLSALAAVLLELSPTGKRKVKRWLGIKKGKPHG